MPGAGIPAGRRVHGAGPPTVVHRADGGRRGGGRSVPADPLQRVRQQGGARPGTREKEADTYLAGVERALATHSDARERLAATAEWTASTARGNAIVRAMLTGCWSERLPAPTLSAVPSSSAVPAQRRADGPLPSPGDFVAMVRDRAVAVLAGPGPARPDTAELARSCELVVRLALSCVAAPPGEGGVADLVRAALHRQLTA